MGTLNQLRDEIHETAKKKGFYDEPREFGTLLMLIVSELSEALEAHRRGWSANMELFDKYTNELIQEGSFGDMELGSGRPNPF